MIESEPWISIQTTEEWNKIQKKLGDVEKRINSITIQLCDELDSGKIRSLESERQRLVDEKRFLVKARKAEPILLNTSDIIVMLEEAKAKEDAEDRAKNSPS